MNLIGSSFVVLSLRIEKLSCCWVPQTQTSSTSSAWHLKQFNFFRRRTVVDAFCVPRQDVMHSAAKRRRTKRSWEFIVSTFCEREMHFESKKSCGALDGFLRSLNDFLIRSHFRLPGLSESEIDCDSDAIAKAIKASSTRYLSLLISLVLSLRIVSSRVAHLRLGSNSETASRHNSRHRVKRLALITDDRRSDNSN